MTAESVSDQEVVQKLQEMDPYAFEQFIGDLWERKGWETTVSKESNDRGVDIRASKAYPYDQQLLIQAKRYGPDTTVGGPDIQQYASLAHQEDGIDKVAIVTTSEFTPQARTMADDLNVKRLNGTDLVAVIRQENAMDLVAAYADIEASHEEGEPPAGRTADETAGAVRSSHGVLAWLPTLRENPADANWLHLTDGEEIRWTGRSSVYTIALSLAIAAGLFLAGLIASGLLFQFLEGTAIPETIGLLPLVVSLVALVRGIRTYLDWVRTLYVITDEEIYTKHGLISRNVTQVRLDRVQNTSYEQSIVERALSFADIQVFTAGSSTDDLVFRSVPNPERVKQTLTRLLSDRGAK